MKKEFFSQVYSVELAEGAIINERHPGFKDDYLILHCLLRKHKIKSCFEIGTHAGWGTQIIKNALGEDSKVYSLDLPDEESDKSEQHPRRNPNGDTGSKCTLPYTQLFGDSRTFDYSKYPVDAFYCDAEHSYECVFRETTAMIKMKPKLIVYHDADSMNVYNAAIDSFGDNEEYELFRVADTRILYALKKELWNH
jgi:hypothetical protein